MGFIATLKEGYSYKKTVENIFDKPAGIGLGPSTTF